VDLSSGQAEDHFIADVGSYFAPEISGYDNTSTHADFGCNVSPWHSSLTVASIKDITRFARCGTKSMPWGGRNVQRGGGTPTRLPAPKGSNKTYAPSGTQPSPLKIKSLSRSEPDPSQEDVGAK